jgi:uncharacterized protein YbjT (DUF2867 family)
MKILVTGATGVLGRLVVDELLALGAPEVRALAVDPAMAELPADVEVVPGSLGRPSTLPAAYAGIDALLLLPPHPPASAEVRRLAAEAGVGRIVGVSGPKGAVGVPFTHLEPAELMVESVLWARQIRVGDVVRDTCGDAVSAPIARTDVAAVAARVLLEDGHEGRTYELTGPEALSRRERVARIGTVLGRELRHVELPRHAAIEELTTDLGDAAACYVAGQEMLVAHPRPVVPTVPALTGRPATTFVDWLHRHTDLF